MGHAGVGTRFEKICGTKLASGAGTSLSDVPARLRQRVTLSQVSRNTFVAGQQVFLAELFL